MLQFALGLSPGNFLSNAGKALGSMAGLIGASLSVGAAIYKIGAAIERGARLQDLSNRLGVGVESLNSLQRGFEATGVAGEGFVGVVNGMLKSLGGFNEMGEPTKDLFAGIGLSVDDLKKKDPAAALEDIFTALEKLPASDATNIAGKIFGRAAGGDALQAARNMEEFSGAVIRARRESELMARNAASFNNLGNAVGELRRQFDTAFAGIAAGITPVLTNITNWLIGLDVEGLGLRIGKVLGGLGEGILQNRVGELFELSLKSGVQGASNFMLTEIVKWGDAIQKAFAEGTKEGASPSLLKRTGAGALGVAQGGLGLWNEVGGIMGVPGAQEMADKRIDQAMANFDLAGIGDGVLTKIVTPFMAGVAGQKNESKEKLDKLIAELAAAAIARAADAGNKPKGAPEAPKGTPGDQKKPRATSVSDPNDIDALTRLGFFSGGGNGSGRGEWVAIKEATKQTVD